MCAYKLNNARYENLYAHIVAVLKKKIIRCLYLHFKNISLICESFTFNFVIPTGSGRGAINRTATTTTRVKEKKSAQS
jgi:hypothetical protein